MKGLEKRIVRDWYAIDYAVFNQPLTTKIASEEFNVAWKNVKRELLQNFYESLIFLNNSLDCEKIKCVHESAKSIAIKAKKLAIKRLKKLDPSLVKEVASIYSYAGKEKALVKATKLILVAETLGHLIGEQNKHTKSLVKILTYALK